MVDVSYNGSYSTQPVEQRIHFLPGQYWTKGTVRDQANDELPERQRCQPVQHQEPFSAPVIQRDQLMRSVRHRVLYGRTSPGTACCAASPPLATSSSQGKANGSSNGYTTYHDIQVMVERRFTKGFQSTFMYTGAKSRVADWMANEYDASPPSVQTTRPYLTASR